MDLWLKYRVENNYWVNDRKEPYATSNLLARHVLPRLGDIGSRDMGLDEAWNPGQGELFMGIVRFGQGRCGREMESLSGHPGSLV